MIKFGNNFCTCSPEKKLYIPATSMLLICSVNDGTLQNASIFQKLYVLRLMNLHPKRYREPEKEKSQVNWLNL